MFKIYFAFAAFYASIHCKHMIGIDIGNFMTKVAYNTDEELIQIPSYINLESAEDPIIGAEAK